MSFAQAALATSRQLPRVVGMKRDIDRLASAAQQIDERIADKLRCDDRHARVDTNHLHMRDGAQPGEDLFEAAQR